jgi:chromosomal replication initiator protein
MEDSQMAAALSRELAERIGPERYALWFGSQTRLCVVSRGLTVQAASPFVRDWLRKHFADDIRTCWNQISGCSAPIEFEVEPSLGTAAAKRAPCTADATCESSAAKPRTHHEAADGVSADASGNSSAWRAAATLTAFVVGLSNECAFRAAELTARGRQQASPVLICGSTGVGKTHLLRAIQREYRRHRPRDAAAYLTAEQFTTGFVEALRGGGLPSFRQKCRGAHLLLIDDLQFFTGKQRTLEELQHTIDTLVAGGRQLVFASDRTLAELRSLGPEMTSRLSGGLICEIAPPEFATRLGIARQFSQEMGMTLGEDVLRAVAAQVTTGARELRGALHRLQATSQAFDEPITTELAAKALLDLARHNTPAVRLGDVQKVVCEAFGLEPADLRSQRKGRSLSEPRMLAMWLARKYTRSAWSEIGEFFGRRSHSTVIAAHRRVERLISTQAEIGLVDRTCSVEDAIRRLESALRTA